MQKESERENAFLDCSMKHITSVRAQQRELFAVGKKEEEQNSFCMCVSITTYMMELSHHKPSSSVV